MKITKEQIQELIEMLADKTLSFGCVVSAGGFTDWLMVNATQGVKQEIIGEEYYLGKPTHGKYTVLGHPILKCYVEQKIAELLDTATNKEFECLDELTRLWQPLGFTTSLQEAFEEIGWEVKEYATNQSGEITVTFHSGDTMELTPIETAKPSAEADLFTYLADLFLKN